MFVRRLAAIVALAIVALCTLEAQSQNQLPPRPPIFLNNNASLYTFPNPNFGKPSQLAFAFVAVAHEDCRLFNNGAKLMPMHRLIAAECMQNGMNGMPINGGGGGGVPIDPLTGLPIGQFPGTFNGINYRRPPMINPWMAAAYRSGYGGYGGYVNPPPTGGYTNYPMQPEAVLTTTQGASSSESGSEASRPKSYKGFGFYEYRYGGFTTVLQTDSTRGFGRGFDSEAELLKEPRPAQ